MKRDSISRLSWERLVVPPDKLEEEGLGFSAWASAPDKLNKMDGEMDGYLVFELLQNI